MCNWCVDWAYLATCVCWSRGGNCVQLEPRIGDSPDDNRAASEERPGSLLLCVCATRLEALHASYGIQYIAINLFGQVLLVALGSGVRLVCVKGMQL